VWRNIEVLSRNRCWRKFLNSCLIYPARKPHLLWAALYGCLWLVWFYHVIPRYLIRGMLFGEKLLNIKRAFWFSLQLLSETFLILRRTKWDIINLYSSSCEASVILAMFSRKLNFLESWIKIDQLQYKPISIYENYTNIYKYMRITLTYINIIQKELKSRLK